MTPNNTNLQLSILLIDNPFFCIFAVSIYVVTKIHFI